jgi:hypothetical protein
MCEELSKLKADAIAAFADAKRVRRYRDLSFREDAELSCEGYKRIDYASASRSTTESHVRMVTDLSCVAQSL